MVNNVVILGLVLNMIASFLIAYGRIFRSKKIIQRNPGQIKNVIRKKRDKDLKKLA